MDARGTILIALEQLLHPFCHRYFSIYSDLSHNLLQHFQVALPVHFSPRTKPRAHLYPAVLLKKQRRADRNQKGETRFRTCKRTFEFRFKSDARTQHLLLCHVLPVPAAHTCCRAIFCRRLPSLPCCSSRENSFAICILPTRSQQ